LKDTLLTYSVNGANFLKQVLLGSQVVRKFLNRANVHVVKA
jgi:hypothetical protein